MNPHFFKLIMSAFLTLISLNTSIYAQDYFRLDSHILSNINPYYNGKQFIFGNYDVFPHNGTSVLLTNFTISNGNGLLAPHFVTTTNYVIETREVVVREVSEYSEWSDWSFDVEGRGNVYGQSIDGRPYSIEISQSTKPIGTIRNDVATALAQDNPSLYSNGQPCRQIGSECVYQYSGAGYQAARDLLDSCKVMTASQGHCMDLRIPQSNNWNRISQTETREVQRRRVIVGVDENNRVIWGLQYRERNLETGEIIDERIVLVDEEVAVEQTEETKAQVKLKLSPILFLDYQQNKLILNQDISWMKKSDVYSKDLFSTLTKIPEADELGNYLVKYRRKIDGALGASLSASIIRGTGSVVPVQPFIGLAPIAGSVVESEYSVYSKSLAKKARKLAIPHAFDLALAMNQGDSTSYETSGGVLGLAGVNLYGLGLGANYISKGSYKTKVTRLEESKVLVERIRTKLNSFGLVTSGALLSISSQKVKEKTSSISYIFDLSSIEAQNAYNFFMDGDQTLAEKIIIADDNQGSVIHTQDMSRQLKAKIKSVGIGVPYVNWSTGRGKITVNEEIQFHADGSKVNTKYAMFVKSRDSRLFNRSENLAIAMVAMDSVYTDEAQSKSQENSYQGQFNVTYRDSNTRKGELDRLIKRISQLTGLSEEIQLDLSTRKIGDLELVFNVVFDQVATNFLMKTAQNLASSEFEELGERLVLAYMNSKSDTLEICPGTEEQRLDCLYFEQAKARRNIKRAHKSLRKMAKARLNGDRQSFISEYAQLGKFIQRSPFAFQTFLNLAKGRGVSLQFNVKGTHIMPYDINLNWNPVVAYPKN